MRDPERITRILAKIETAWRRAPDLRLSQLYLNVMGDHVPPDGVWSIEDDDFEKRLDAWIEAHP